MTSVPALALGMPGLDPAIAGALDAGLASVEDRLRTAVASDYPFVTETSRHLVDAGGKRFRPLLVLLAAHLGDPDRPQVREAAVVVELTHLATLYHDDVMDEAMRRRGTDSANARWDNTVAILTGDFLFAKASEILADLGPDAVRIQARTFERLCTGQIRETVGPEPGQDPVAHHLRVLADKTGSLIATSGRFGAMMSGADDEAIEVMTEFGERIGVAFQLADDILDIASDSEVSGKTAGTDLREGVRTLPVLMALAGDDPRDARLRELLAEPLIDDALHAEALSLLRSNHAMEDARAEARRWSQAARGSLAPLPESPVRAALEGLCDVVVGRTA